MAGLFVFPANSRAPQPEGLRLSPNRFKFPTWMGRKPPQYIKRWLPYNMPSRA